MIFLTIPRASYQRSSRKSAFPSRREYFTGRRGMQFPNSGIFARHSCKGTKSGSITRMHLAARVSQSLTLCRTVLHYLLMFSVVLMPQCRTMRRFTLSVWCQSKDKIVVRRANGWYLEENDILFKKEEDINTFVLLMCDDLFFYSIT